MYGTASPFILTRTQLQKVYGARKLFFYCFYYYTLRNYPELSMTLMPLSFAGDGADEDDDGFI